MQLQRGVISLLSLAGLSSSVLAQAQEYPGAAHAVFYMTNSATGNEVVSHERTNYGTLLAAHHFATGGARSRPSP